MFQLSGGSLRKILDGQSVTDPLLHILQIKTIQNNMDGMTRYKVTMFDGETQHTFGILATQKNELVESGELRIGSVIKLMEYAANVLSKDPPKVVIILLNFEIVGEMDPKRPQPAAAANQHSNATSEPPAAKPKENIEPSGKESTPAPVRNAASDASSGAAPKSKSFYGSKGNETAAPVHNSAKLNSSSAAAPSSAASGPAGTFNGFKVFGISSLNPYQNKWSIKVRVTNKSQMRKYTNAKGEGKLFNVEFMDQTGEIRASGFNEQVDKFYDMLQIDGVYYVSRCQLKTANKQYSKLNNDYEMTFGNDTVIEPCQEADSLPPITLNLVPFAELPNKSANDLVDVIGVVRSAGDTTTIVVKASGREMRKRDLQLVDNSNCSVNCTLWGNDAEAFEPADNPVLLLKAAKVGDYNGRTLSVTQNTVIQRNPDIPEAHTLKGWFDQCIESATINDLSSSGGPMGGGGMGGGANLPANWKTLDSLKDEKMGTMDKADYFSAKAVIVYAKKDNCMYMACPSENCNKKVIDQNDGQYRCEKCSKTGPDYKWRMMLNVNVADHTDSNWATCFQETAETVLDFNANDLGHLKLNNDTKFDEIFGKCVFREFNFKFRAKMETYNDERRVKVSVVTVEPVDYVTSGRRLLTKLQAYAKNNA